MVEPLLHFAAPFVSLRAIGLDVRKTLVASVIALTPDLDVYFRVHRSQSHSVVVLALVLLPLLVLTRKRRTARTILLLGAFGVLTHLVLDLFQSYTPLLWPFVSESLWITATVNLHVGGALTLTWSTELMTSQEPIESFLSFDEPILTAPGLGISLVLLAPSLVTMLRVRGRARNSPGQIEAHRRDVKQ